MTTRAVDVASNRLFWRFISAGYGRQHHPIAHIRKTNPRDIATDLANPRQPLQWSWPRHPIWSTHRWNKAIASSSSRNAVSCSSAMEHDRRPVDPHAPPGEFANPAQLVVTIRLSGSATSGTRGAIDFPPPRGRRIRLKANGSFPLVWYFPPPISQRVFLGA
jgi:hypothetical protein